MKRHELTDEQWEQLVPLVRRRITRTGRPRRDDRQMLNGVFWILGTGAPWRDLPGRYGPWQTVHRYCSQWRRNGGFSAIVEALQIKLDDKGLIDWTLALRVDTSPLRGRGSRLARLRRCIDRSNVRAARAAGAADKKVSRSTPENPRTTRWAAAEAGLDRSSTWLLTARGLRSRSK